MLLYDTHLCSIMLYDALWCLTVCCLLGDKAALHFSWYRSGYLTCSLLSIMIGPCRSRSAQTRWRPVHGVLLKGRLRPCVPIGLASRTSSPSALTRSVCFPWSPGLWKMSWPASYPLYPKHRRGGRGRVPVGWRTETLYLPPKAHDQRRPYHRMRFAQSPGSPASNSMGKAVLIGRSTQRQYRRRESANQNPQTWSWWIKPSTIHFLRLRGKGPMDTTRILIGRSQRKWTRKS